MSESSEDIKRQLSDTATLYRDELREGIKLVGQSLGKTGINALIISGALVGGYLMFRLISGSDDTPKKKKIKIVPQEYEYSEPKPPSVLDRIADRLLEEALVFALSLAKEKLREFLDSQYEENGDTQGNKSE